ncbi:MAG: type II 3-dehydroquinate dehydratase [Dehalococcoidia bacterium]|nr:type II 3-dehydroquinate dehydratase [Dehalococcoidia bacterium]
MLDFLQEHLASGRDGAVIDAGAWTRASVALAGRDRGRPQSPSVEVHHLEHARGGSAFRHQSLIGGVCAGQVTGLGRHGYTAAVEPAVQPASSSAT